MATGRFTRLFYCAGVAALLLAAAALLSPLPARAAPPGPPAPGLARIWIYRPYEPYVSLDRPLVRLNGASIGISEPGGAFYRDVPAGEYQVTVDSRGRDVYQFVTVAVAPGQEVYIEVQVLRDWDSGGSRGHWYHPTFYTRLQVPQVAQAAIARSAFYGGATIAPPRNSPG